MDEWNDMADIKQFMLDQELMLRAHKLSLHHQGSPNGGKENKPSTSVSSPSLIKKEEHGENTMVITKSVAKDAINIREQEKNILMNALAESKSENLGVKKVSNKVQITKINNNFAAHNEREKEKDRLAEIFASSSYQYSKPSNYEVSKNLNSGLGVKKEHNSTQEQSSPSFNPRKNSSYEGRDSFVSRRSIPDEKTLRDKYDIPEILVSEYHSDSSVKDSPSIVSGRKMVRMGEYSPNLNRPGVRPVLGVGECDERRRLAQEQRRQEFQQYTQKRAEHSLSKMPQDNSSNRQLKEVGTQTEWENELVELDQGDRPLSPKPWTQNKNHCRQSTCASPLPYNAVSPTTLYQCLNSFTEKEVKEQLYREELKKQIEEKNRLKEEMRKKEEEEEAKIEAKIQRDLEKMKVQYEEERLQRLELAIRKKEQEEILRQRLALEQEKSLQQSQEKKKQLKKKSITPRNTTQKQEPERRTVSFSQSLPTNCASKALADVHETLRQPLLEIQDPQPSRSVSPSPRTVGALNQFLNRSPSPPIRVRRSKDVDVLVRKTVFTSNAPSSTSQQAESPRSVVNVNERLREVDRLLKEPLLPTQSFQVLPPMSPPLLHATLPPTKPSASSQPTSSKRRSNANILEDKWKTPHESRQNTSGSDVLTTHNRHMLTQLGAFRRHLQQEKLRMQQRVTDDSP